MNIRNTVRRRLGCRVATGLLWWLAGAAGAQTLPAAQVAPEVSISDGALAGVNKGAVSQYLGIPYAQAPLGPLRWASPRPPMPWTGVRNAGKFGAPCPQDRFDFITDGVGSSEDCLSLNVFTPNGPSQGPRPVIVFIHGGGYVLGSSRSYDATRMAQAMDAVVVTFNYRLGALGLLWTSGMTGESQRGNFALQDQQAALRWVQANIARFNGDAGNVTLSGHSVGGMAVSAHLVSPSSRGLFHKAILLSGVLPHRLRSPQAAAIRGDAFAEKIGCPAGASQLACLRAKTLDELLAASQRYTDISRDGLQWQLFLDGSTLPVDVAPAVARGQFHQVPLMLGTTLNEGTAFVSLPFHFDLSAMTEEEYSDAAERIFGKRAKPLLTRWLYRSDRLGSPAHAYSQMFTDGVFACLTDELAKLAARKVPVYAYEFADTQAPSILDDPFLPTGAYHLADLPYLFQGTVARLFSPDFAPAQWELSAQMVRYWARFARTGDPNGAGATGDAVVGDPVWRRFDSHTTPYLTLAPGAIATQKPGAYHRAHNCLVWPFIYLLKEEQGGW